MIPIEKEDPKLYEEFGVYEACTFCKVNTIYWHTETNNPVCPECAKTHKVSELTNWFTQKTVKKP